MAAPPLDATTDDTAGIRLGHVTNDVIVTCRQLPDEAIFVDDVVTSTNDVIKPPSNLLHVRFYEVQFLSSQHENLPSVCPDDGRVN